MLIVDAQIHIWAKGTPSPWHRQAPYSKNDALAVMNEAGVDRALIHPPMWDPTRTSSRSRLAARILTASRSWAGSRSIAGEPRAD